MPYLLLKCASQLARAEMSFIPFLLLGNMTLAFLATQSTRLHWSSLCRSTNQATFPPFPYLQQGLWDFLSQGWGRRTDTFWRSFTYTSPSFLFSLDIAQVWFKIWNWTDNCIVTHWSRRKLIEYIAVSLRHMPSFLHSQHWQHFSTTLRGPSQQQNHPSFLTAKSPKIQNACYSVECGKDTCLLFQKAIFNLKQEYLH